MIASQAVKKRSPEKMAGALGFGWRSALALR
jgi:hypothetical protein